MEIVSDGLNTNEIDNFLADRLGKSEQAEVTTQVEAEVKTETTETVVEQAQEQTTEQVQETTETAAETTPFFDLPDVFKEETTASETTNVEVPETIKQELEAYKAQLEKLKSNPLVEALEKYGHLENFDIKEYAKSLVNKDYTKMDVKDLVREKLSIEYPELDGDDLDASVDEYLAYKGIDGTESKIRRLETEKELRRELQSMSTQETPEYIKALEEAASKVKPIDVQAQVEQMKQVFEADKQELTNFASQIKGQEIYGLQLGDEHVNKITQVYDMLFNPNTVPFTKSDGSFDTKAFTLFAYKVANYENSLKAAYELGKKEVLKTRTQVDPLGGAVATTPTTDTRSVRELLKDDILSIDPLNTR